MPSSEYSISEQSCVVYVYLLVTAASSSSPDMPLRAVVLSAQSSVLGRMLTYRAKMTFIIVFTLDYFCLLPVITSSIITRFFHPRYCRYKQSNKFTFYKCRLTRSRENFRFRENIWSQSSNFAWSCKQGTRARGHGILGFGYLEFSNVNIILLTLTHIKIE